MSWTTISWSMAAAVCLTFAVLHFAVWLRQRDAWAYLLFTIAAVAAAALAALELKLISASTPAAYGEVLRWMHVSVAILVVALVWFIHVYLQAGRRWLVWAVSGLRVSVLPLNFLFYPNATFAEISSLQHVEFLGAMFSIPVGEMNPARFLILLSNLAMLVFVLDSAFSAWKQGRRRGALVIGGATVAAIVLVATFSELMTRGILPGVFIAYAFLLIVVAMAFELTEDLIRARELARELRDTQQRMSLAVEAADLGLWEWGIERDRVWSTGASADGDKSRRRHTLSAHLEAVHPDDREHLREAINRAVNGGGDLREEFRFLGEDAGPRWIAVRGRVEYGLDEKPLRLSGVSQDITERKYAEKELQELRLEMAQFNRVLQMNQLSSSLAHEISQPLGIILSNAQAAQEYLRHEPPNVTEVSEILMDIVAADRRAADTIQRMRELYKRGEISFKPLRIDGVIEEVLKLVETDFASRNVIVECQLAEQMPLVTGDRIQLLQVLLNLILNAADAMASNSPHTRRIDIATVLDRDTVRVAVRDQGPGLPDKVDVLFKPFYTTKPKGLGMGLAICLSIIEAHSGRLWAENHPEKGAVFFFEIPVARSQESP